MTRLIVLLTVVCGLALAACGGKSGQEDVSGGTTDATEVTADRDGGTETAERDPCKVEWGECGWADDIYCPCPKGSYCTVPGKGPDSDSWGGGGPYGHCVSESDYCETRFGNFIECGFAWSPDAAFREPPYCGDCPEGQVCIVDYNYPWTNHCCELQCGDSDMGPACGDNGCGGTCGECDEGFMCGAVQDRGGQTAKVCLPTCAAWCNLQSFECGTHAAVGPTDTDNGECLCGQCPEGDTCTDAGTCCIPDCDGKECGDDGCGGSCGQCDYEDECSEDGTCVCIPDCGDQTGPIPDCGSDGCGGYCECPGEGGECLEKDYDPEEGPWGFCWYPEESCPPLCAGGKCGVVPTQIVGEQVPTCDCGDCPAGQVCLEPDDEGGTCCTPDCDGKACGEDGCGGSCGECDGLNMQCVEGECQLVCDCLDDADCATLEDFNLCNGELVCGLTTPCQCELDPDSVVECPEGQICIPATGECCTPDCTGKECGPDGCGGSCGECPVKCTTHDQCGAGEVCLGEPDEWAPKEVCGLCGDAEPCNCGKPSWPEQYICSTDADCETNLMCGDQCDDCPPCPACINGWCAYETFEVVECLCTGCA